MIQKKETLDDYELLDKLGHGAYGDVLLARHKTEGQNYAVKILEKRLLAKEKKQYQVFIEKEVLQRVNHPGLINLKASFQSQDQIYLVLELVEGGDFANFLKINCMYIFQKILLATLTHQIIQFYTAEIVSILEVLHTNGIAHRDVKPENIMVSSDLHIKMIDFGTATFFDQSQLPQSVIERLQELKDLSRKDDRFKDDIDEYQQKHKATFVGTAEYVSPELLEDEICGPQADLWALGCIIYKMYVGNTPFNDSTEYLIFQKIKQVQYAKTNKIPAEAMSLIQSLLQRDPMSRLGADIVGLKNSYKQLKAHPFFKDIDWTNIFKQPGPKGVQIMQKRTKSQDIADFDNSKEKRAKTLIKSEIMLTGLVNKKTGWMIYKSRNMILYDIEQPKLEYYDPNTGEKKGQIILTKDIRIELLKGQFNIDVPGKKKYFFKECEQPATLWVEKIKEVLDRRSLK